jgi:hypothetical protein
MRTGRGSGCRKWRLFDDDPRSLLGMSDHLRCLGVTRVVMEATPGLLEAGQSAARSR